MFKEANIKKGFGWAECNLKNEWFFVLEIFVKK